MLEFTFGLATMGFAIAGLFFLKFWARTGERLFASFAVAFALFAGEQALLAWEGVPREEQTWVYLMRLLGFVLIISAVVSKNRSARSP